MKFVYILIALTILNTGVLCTRSRTKNAGGIQVAIDEDTIARFEKKALPKILDIVRKTKIPDISHTITGSVANTYVKVEKCEFTIGKITSDNIKVKFEGNNIVAAHTEDLTASGSFEVTATTAGVPVWSKVTITVKDFDLNVPVKLGMKTQKKSGKKVLHATVLKENFTIHVELEITLNSALLNWIKSFFDEKIKALIKQHVDKDLKDTIVPIINAKIDEATELMPSTFNLKDTIHIDYSLLRDPVVAGKLMILSLDGRIFNLGDPNSHPGFPNGVKVLAPMTNAPKGIKIQISTYTFNTGLYALYYRSMLMHEFQTPSILDLIPESKGFIAMMGLSPTNHFRNAIKKFAGPAPTVMISVAAHKLPQISLEGKVFKSTFTIILSFSLKSFDKKTNKYGNWEIFTGFETEISTSAHGQMAEGGAVNFTIGELKINKFETKINKFAGEDFILKWLLNFGLGKAKTTLNEKYLHGVKYPIPEIQGCKLTDSTVAINDDHIEVQLHANFDLMTLRRRNRRRHRYYKK